jgi:hypothetical protein
MKKLLLPAALTLAVAAFASSPPAAFAHKYFGLFTGCDCCKHGKCSFCVRPYNAFSPVACGHINMGPISNCGHGFGYGDDGCLSVNWQGIPCAGDFECETGCEDEVAAPADEVVAQEEAGPPIDQASAPPPARPVSLTPTRMPVGPQTPPQPTYNPYAAGYHPAYYPSTLPYYVPTYSPASVPAYWRGQ